MKKQLLISGLCFAITTFSYASEKETYFFTSGLIGSANVTNDAIPLNGEVVGESGGFNQVNSQTNTINAAFKLGIGTTLYKNLNLELYTGLDYLGELYKSEFELNSGTSGTLWINHAFVLPLMIGLSYRTDFGLYGSVYGGVSYVNQQFRLNKIDSNGIDMGTQQENKRRFQPSFELQLGYQVDDQWSVYASYFQTFGEHQQNVDINDSQNNSVPMTYSAIRFGVRYTIPISNKWRSPSDYSQSMQLI